MVAPIHDWSQMSEQFLLEHLTWEQTALARREAEVQSEPEGPARWLLVKLRDQQRQVVREVVAEVERRGLKRPQPEQMEVSQIA